MQLAVHRRLRFFHRPGFAGQSPDLRRGRESILRRGVSAVVACVPLLAPTLILVSTLPAISHAAVKIAIQTPAEALRDEVTRGDPPGSGRFDLALSKMNSRSGLALSG